MFVSHLQNRKKENNFFVETNTDKHFNRKNSIKTNDEVFDDSEVIDVSLVLPIFC